jgi:hypothetical protein
VTFSSWIRTPSFASTAFHDPAGELVDDLHLAVLDDVVDVALVQRLRLQRLVQMVHELDVPRVVEVLDPERALDLLDRALLRSHRLELLVVGVVGVRCEALLHILRRNRRHRPNDAREVVVDLRGGLGLAGDDQRRPRLVDEDRVDLVDDREGVTALHDALQRDGHVVAQVVEAELGVRAVRDVGRVGDLPLGERHHVLDERHRRADALVDGPRPFGVALREIVVDGDEMHAGARHRVEEERLRGDERLSLARLHLGDVALVEDDAAHHLDLEELDAAVAPERLADRRVRLEEELLERLSVLEPLPELGRLAPQLVVAELLEVGLQREDVLRLLCDPLEPAALADPENLLEAAQSRCHARPRVARPRSPSDRRPGGAPARRSRRPAPAQGSSRSGAVRR